MAITILKTLLGGLVSILGLGLTILLLGCIGFALIFGEAAIWIVRIVLIVIIAKFVWRIIIR